MTRRVLISCISLLTCALLAPAAGAAPAVGKAAPRFALRDLDGALVSLSDLAYPGDERSHRPKQVVVLDFFRTDCAPCRKGLPKLISLHKKFKDKKVRVILMALLEEDEGQEKLDRFLKSTRLPFSVLVDAYAVASKKYVAKKGGVSLPALFVIDRAGILRARYAGAIDAKAQTNLYKQISDLLK